MYIAASKSKVFGRSIGLSNSGVLRHPCAFCKPEQQNCSSRAATERGIDYLVGELFVRPMTCSQELSRRFWRIKKIVNGGLIPLLQMVMSVIVMNSGSVAFAWESQWKSGVWCERISEYALANEHETRLVASLRRISGYSGLEFDPEGSLCLGDTSVVGGSQEARQILASALISQSRFVIEDFSGSGGVAFGQAAPEIIYEDQNGKRSKLWRLRLDFSDFEEMKACSEVRSTFDEGFTLLHELLHGLGYEDPKGHSELGDCEQRVNLVRSELGLPLRERYFGDTWRIADRLTSVRLRFKSRRGTERGESFESRYLFFIVRE